MLAPYNIINGVKIDLCKIVAPMVPLHTLMSQNVKDRYWVRCHITAMKSPTT